MSDATGPRRFTVALTGGIASGKSAVSDRFAALGADVIDADLVSRELVAPGGAALEEIIAAFGKDVLGPQLTALYDKHPKIGEVRGKGVFWAVEMVADRTTKEPLDDATMKQIVAEGDKRGLILGVHNNRIHVTPPCVISADEATQGVEILDQVLTAAGC